MTTILINVNNNSTSTSMIVTLRFHELRIKKQIGDYHTNHKANETLRYKFECELILKLNNCYIWR